MQNLEKGKIATPRRALEGEIKCDPANGGGVSVLGYRRAYPSASQIQDNGPIAHRRTSLSDCEATLMYLRPASCAPRTVRSIPSLWRRLDAVFDVRSITTTGSSLGRLPLEGLIAVAKGDPGLLAAGPNMPGRPQPGCVVQRPGTDADYAGARQAINPTCTLRAHEARVEPSTVGHSLNRPRLARGAMECRLRRCDP